MSERTKVSVSGNMVYDREKDEFLRVQTKKTQRYDPLFERWIKVSEGELPRVTEAEFQGLSKRIEVRVISLRSATDYETNRQIQNPFIQTVTFEIEKSSATRHMYLSRQTLPEKNPSPIKDAILFHNLKSGTRCAQIGFNEESLKRRFGETGFCKVKVGKEKKITWEQVRKLSREPDVFKHLMIDNGGILEKPPLYFSRM